MRATSLLVAALLVGITAPLAATDPLDDLVRAYIAAHTWEAFTLT